MLRQVQGTTVPALGFGTWELNGDDCRDGVRTALDLGYRHIDTAQVYGNEHLVGEGILASGVDRDDIFLTTKVWNEDQAPERMAESVHRSLSKLKTDHVDLLLLHWPVDLATIEKVLETLTALQSTGVTRHIGVSNYTPPLLERAIAAAPIFAVQVEHHPYLAQPRLIELCHEHDILFTAYSPLARGEALTDSVVTGIAEARDATPAQVVLRWVLDEGDKVAVIPKATAPARIEENFGALHVGLGDDDRAAIAALDRDERQVDPPFAPAWER